MSTKSAAGEAGTITSPLPSWPASSSSSSDGSGGKNQPGLTIPQVSRILRLLLPHRTWSRNDLRVWLATTQARNAAATQAHARRRQRKRLALALNSP